MPSAPQLLIVQPWFGAPGHPAQSLINTARAIGRSEAISYLVACDRGDDPRLTALRTVAGSVATFQSHGSSIRRGTWRALRGLRCCGGNFRDWNWRATPIAVLAFRTVLRRGRQRRKPCCPLSKPDDRLFDRVLGILPAQYHPPGAAMVAAQGPQPNPRQQDFPSIGTVRTANVGGAARRAAINRDQVLQ